MKNAMLAIMVSGLISLPAGAFDDGFESYTATNANDWTPVGGWESWFGANQGGIYDNQGAPDGNNAWGDWDGSVENDAVNIQRLGVPHDYLVAHIRADSFGANGAVKLLSGDAGGDKPELSWNSGGLDWDTHDGGGWHQVFPGGTGEWHKVELDLDRTTGFARVRVDEGPWSDSRKYNINDDPLPLPLNENVYMWVHNADGGIDLVQAIPEPATIGLLILGGLLSGIRRRRS